VLNGPRCLARRGSPPLGHSTESPRRVGAISSACLGWQTVQPRPAVRAEFT